MGDSVRVQIRGGAKLKMHTNGETVESVVNKIRNNIYIASPNGQITNDVGCMIAHFEVLHKFSWYKF